MEWSKKFTLISACILMCAFLVSCGVRHSLHQTTLYQDSTFSVGDLQNKRLAVCGMASSFVSMSETERVEISMLLSTLLFDKCVEESSTMEIFNTKQVRYNLGEKLYTPLMKSLDSNSELDLKMMQSLSDSLPNTDYLLLGTIEDEVIRNDSVENTVESDGEEMIETTYTRTYVISSEFQIYNLKSGKKVWHNAIENEASKSEKTEEKANPSLGEIVTDIIFGEDEQLDPVKLKREEVLEGIYKKLAKLLIQ
ncbi:hypothetical protein HQ585_01830 [candidate division KSB1 bacterium]|nr:hypothetical protein [candidate division KSB1 bacterium]